MKINELGYPNEPLVVEEPIANESPFISEKASVIGETVPQGDPKEEKKKPKDMTWDVDGEAVMLELYNDSKSLIQAKRKIAGKYKWGSKEQMQAVVDFYAIKDAEKKNLGGSELGVSTSDGKGGDELDTLLGNPSGNTFGELGYNIPAVDVAATGRYIVPDEEYRKNFGRGIIWRLDKVEGDAVKSNIHTLLSTGESSEFWDQVRAMEADAFQKFAKKKFENNPGFDMLMNQKGNEALKDFIEISDLENPLINEFDLIMDLIARTDRLYKSNQLDEDLEGTTGLLGVNTNKSLVQSGGDLQDSGEPAKRTFKKINEEYTQFFTDMLTASLPNGVVEDESALKDLEYYFKVNKGYMLDFTGEGVVGNQSFFSEDGALAGSAKKVGLDLVNAYLFVASKGTQLYNWAQGVVADPLFSGNESYDEMRAMENDRLASMQQQIRDNKKTKEEISSRMNAHKRNITENILEWYNYDGDDFNWDWNLISSASSQSFRNIVEAGPYVVGGAALSWMGVPLIPTSLAMGSYATVQDAIHIEDDLRFDDFLDEETGEIHGYYTDGEKTGARDMIEVSEGDTEEDIRAKILDRFTLQRNDSNRMWYLTETFAVNVATDMVIFGRFHKAVSKAKKMNQYNASAGRLALEMLKGMGVSIPQSSSAVFINTYSRIMLEGAHTGDPNLDSKNAFLQATEVTLATLPISPAMYTLGWARGYARNFANHKVGRDNLNAIERIELSRLHDIVTGKKYSYLEKNAARQEMLRVKQEGRVRRQNDVNFYDYIAEKKPADMDEIGVLNTQIDHVLTNINNLKGRSKKGVRTMGLSKTPKEKGAKDMTSPALDIYQQALTGLLQKKQAIVDSHRAGYEAHQKGVDVKTQTDVEITVTPEKAKQSLIDNDVKTPTPNQIKAEQIKLSEIEFRGTPEWVVKNIEGQKSTLTQKALDLIFKSEKWAILSGENPGGKGQTEAQNLAANKKLRKYLEDNGIAYHEVTGKFYNGENSFLVEGLSPKQAKEIARLFNQHSVVTKEGLIKSDESIIEFSGKIERVDHTATDANNFTSIKMKNGDIFSFKLPFKVKVDAEGKPILDADGKQIVEGKDSTGKTISEAEFFDTGSKNFFTEAALKKISDADALASLELKGTKPKGKKGEYTPAQIRDKKIQLANEAALKVTQGEGGTTPIIELPNMRPGTKEWNTMWDGVMKIISPPPANALKVKPTESPSNTKFTPPVNTKPKGAVGIALHKLGQYTKGVYNNWLTTNPMGWSERGWNPLKRREGPGEIAGNIITRQGRSERVRDMQLNRDLFVINSIFKDVRFDPLTGKKVSKEQYARHIKEVQEFMRGNDDARVAFLTEGQRASLDYARARIDGLGDVVISTLSSKKNLTAEEKLFLQKIRSGQGTYLKRSYEAFTDDGKWIKELNLEFQYMPANKKVLIDDAVRFLMDEQGKSQKEAEGAVKGYLRDIADGFNNSNKSSGLIGALDTRMFKGRKDIPEPFRKLLGEISDPIYNYAATVDKLASYVGDFQYQTTLSNHLINTGLGKASDAQGNGPQGWERLGEKGKAFDILADIWVPKGVKKIYNDMQPLGTAGGPGKGGDIFRWYLKQQARVKGWKTVWSPGTIARNFLSGIWLSANAGHNPAADIGNMSNMARMAWGDDTAGLTKTKKTMESDKLTELGVIGDTARAGEYLMMLQDFNTSSKAVTAAEAAGGKGLRKAKGDLDKVMQSIYAFGDDYYKLNGYYQELMKLQRDDPGMSRADAEVLAAERIRGGYPTYSGLPRNIKRVRKSFMTGMFVSFAYEVPRTTANNFRYVLQDYNAGRTQMATERLLGLGLASGSVAALTAYNMAKYGWDEDDVNAIQGLGPDWGKSSNYLPVSEGKDGVLTFLDLSSVIPNEVMWRPVNVLFKDGAIPTEEQLNQALFDVLTPYIAVDATSNLVRELVTGKKTNGGDIGYWDPNLPLVDNIDENWDEILKHVMVGVGPGYFRNIQDFARANNIMPEFFGGKLNEYKEYTNEDAMLRLLGISIQTFDLGLATPWKVSEEAQNYQDYKRFHLKANKIDLWMGKDFATGKAPVFNNTDLTMDRVSNYDSPDPDREHLQNIGVDMAQHHYEAFRNAQAYADLAFKSDLSEEKFFFTLKDSNISEADAAALWINAQDEVPLSLAKQKWKEERFLYLQNTLGWEAAPRTIEEIKDPTKSQIKEKRDQLLENRGDRRLAPWGFDLLTKSKMSALRDRLVYIHEKRGTKQSIIDAKIEQLYNTMAEVNGIIATEWARLNNIKPSLTPDEQKEANEQRKRDEENERQEED